MLTAAVFIFFCLLPDRDNETDSLKRLSEDHQQGKGVLPLSYHMIILKVLQILNACPAM